MHPNQYLSRLLSCCFGSATAFALACAAVLQAGPTAAQQPQAPNPEITVAIQPDIPPYVMDGATKGIEVELVRKMLISQKVRFIQMPYDQLETAVADKKADVAVTVRRIVDGVAYSKDFITFANAAISKKSDGLVIDSDADLAGHQILAWEGADRELGGDFATLYAPGAPQRHNYVEFADQKEQVRRFWASQGAVAVIDRSIFSYFSRVLGHSLDDVVFHEIFPKVTNFRVGFSDPNTRDEFNQKLTEVCQSGEYAKILARYYVELPRTVCEWRRAAADRPGKCFAEG